MWTFCNHTNNHIIIKRIYVQAILGDSILIYFSLLHFFSLLLNKTQNWTIGRAHFNKTKHPILCKKILIDRYLYIWRVLAIMYYHIVFSHLFTLVGHKVYWVEGFFAFMLFFLMFTSIILFSDSIADIRQFYLSFIGKKYRIKIFMYLNVSYA